MTVRDATDNAGGPRGRAKELDDPCGRTEPRLAPRHGVDLAATSPTAKVRGSADQWALSAAVAGVTVEELLNQVAAVLAPGGALAQLVSAQQVGSEDRIEVPTMPEESSIPDPAACHSAAAGGASPDDLAPGQDPEGPEDQRVHEHLARAAADAGLTVAELLDQANAALSEGALPPHLVPASPTATDTITYAFTVAAVRPANREWGVATLVGGVPAAQPRPCTGAEPCPWRRDAPRGQFPAAAYRHSADTSRPGTNRAFACHSSTSEKLKICAGWLLVEGHRNPQIHARMTFGDLARPELPEAVELYSSYRAMAIANGVDPADPALP